MSRQAAFLRGTTERLFRAAGLEPDMGVLDVGSGAGDVALLVAELVGVEGEVVGVDVEGAALWSSSRSSTSIRRSAPGRSPRDALE